MSPSQAASSVLWSRLRAPSTTARAAAAPEVTATGLYIASTASTPGWARVAPVAAGLEAGLERVGERPTLRATTGFARAATRSDETKRLASWMPSTYIRIASV